MTSCDPSNIKNVKHYFQLRHSAFSKCSLSLMALCDPLKIVRHTTHHALQLIYLWNTVNNDSCRVNHSLRRHFYQYSIFFVPPSFSQAANKEAKVDTLFIRVDQEIRHIFSVTLLFFPSTLKIQALWLKPGPHSKRLQHFLLNVGHCLL